MVEIDSGKRPGTSTVDAQRIAQLERENKGCAGRPTILNAASAFFTRQPAGSTPEVYPHRCWLLVVIVRTPTRRHGATMRHTNGQGKGAGALVLVSPADVDPRQVSRLRDHGGRGGTVALAIDGIAAPRAVKSSIALTAAAKDCGCEVGGKVAAATLISWLVAHRLDSGRVGPHSVREAATLAGVTIAGALVGKAIGIVAARHRLRRELRSLRREAVASQDRAVR